MTMKLHCFGESGNAYKAALALELSGLDWTPVYVDFFNGAARTPEYRETINAMGEATSLQTMSEDLLRKQAEIEALRTQTANYKVQLEAERQRVCLFGFARRG